MTDRRSVTKRSELYKNNVIAEKVFKISGQAEAVRVKNYSYEAIEEFLSNAIYHKSYQIHEPVTVRIEADKIEITSSPDQTGRFLMRILVNIR